MLRAVAWESLVVMVMDVEEGRGVVVTDGDDGDGGKGGGLRGGRAGMMSASIIPCSLIALHQSCPALT